MAIWLAVIPAAVNFMFTFVGLYLVERLGRRKLTLASLVGMAFLNKVITFVTILLILVIQLMHV